MMPTSIELYTNQCSLNASDTASRCGQQLSPGQSQNTHLSPWIYPLVNPCRQITLVTSKTSGTSVSD